MEHKEINFSPYATNVLDVISKTLYTPDGRMVKVERHGLYFQVYMQENIEDKRLVCAFETAGNIDVSYYLNSKQVGYMYNTETGHVFVLYGAGLCLAGGFVLWAVGNLAAIIETALHMLGL